MRISDLIAGFISDTLRETKGSAELQRAELASKFNCVPSQINYVISTRFTPERGYIVESRRGGGGYIRITQVTPDPGRLIMHTVNSIGGSIDTATLGAFVANLLQSGVIDNQIAKLIVSATCDNALKSAEQSERGALRAGIAKQMLINIL